MTHVPAPLPLDEAQRFEALHRLNLLDSPPEVLFDDIVALAALSCATPIALVSLIDQERQWFKACIGLDVTETPRDQAFCAHAILRPDALLIVPDTHEDPRFQENPLVMGAPHIRFYAGAPILSPEGQPLGTVCVIDTIPRTLDAAQQAALVRLARQTSTLLRLRQLGIEKSEQAEALSSKVIAALADDNLTHTDFRQTHRIASIGQLTSGVAHDFNNLLQAVSVTFQLLTRKAGQPEDVARLSKTGMDTVTRGAKLVNQLLAFSRNQGGDQAALSVSAHIEGMGEMLSRVIGPEVDLRFDLDTSAAQLTCDSAQLESAILNMVINARDAMRSRGSIVIQTRLLPLAQDAADTADAFVRQYLTLSVKDDGPGMSAQVVNRVFEPFFTTKGDGKGTGLGLAQVYGFAKTAGGSVEAISAPGEGCEIRMTLQVTLDDTDSAAQSISASTPRVQDDAQHKAAHAVAPQPEDKPAIALAASRILLVEDDAVIRASLAELLTHAGYSVLPVASCFAAIPSLPGYAPDVVITDYAMPGFSGAALARLLKDIRPDLPVLFLTGISNLETVKAALPPDAVVLQKPMIPGELRKALDQLLTRKKQGQGVGSAST